MCVSYYHFYRMLSMVKYHGNFSDFCALFTSGQGNSQNVEEFVLYWSNNAKVICFKNFTRKMGLGLSCAQVKCTAWQIETSMFVCTYIHSSVHVHIHMHLLMTYWPFSSLQMILAFPVLPFILKVTVESWLPFMSPSGRVIQWTSSFLLRLTYCW